jgi:hypothetical protein
LLSEPALALDDGVRLRRRIDRTWAVATRSVLSPGLNVTVIGTRRRLRLYHTGG